MPVQQFSTCNELLDFIISTMLQAKSEQTEEGPMLSLMFNWLHSVEEAILASSNARAVDATCRDFWGGATVVRGFLYEGGVWTRSDALG